MISILGLWCSISKTLHVGACGSPCFDWSFARGIVTIIFFCFFCLFAMLVDNKTVSFGKGHVGP